MMYSKKEIGEFLNRELKKGYNVERISNWADELLINMRDQRSPELDDILRHISVMAAGPEFEYTEQELRSLAEELINGQNNVSERDERQLQLMANQFDFFEKKRIPLHSFVGNFEFLINALEFEDKEWEGTVFEAISTLETINAMQIIEENEGGPKVDKEEADRVISKTVSDLKKIVNGKLMAVRQGKIIKVSYDEIKSIFDELIQEKKSREEIASWAETRVLAFDSGDLQFEPIQEEEKICRTIFYLSEVSSRDSDSKFVHSGKDFLDFRREIGV